jgi:hypothetical protein
LVQPRIVVVCCLAGHGEEGEEAEEEGPRRRLQWRRKELARRTRGTAVPALLHVNRESRDVGLAHYELAFAWSIPKSVADTSSSSSVSRPARVYFNYSLDALYMTGEPGASPSMTMTTTTTTATTPAIAGGFDGYSPTHYLCKDDLKRVRHIAYVFAELGYTETDSLAAIVRLSRVMGDFAAADRLLLTVSDEDEEQMKGRLSRGPGTAMQRLWDGWMSGTTVMSTMADKEMLLIKEEDLIGFVASHQGC